MIGVRCQWAHLSRTKGQSAACQRHSCWVLGFRFRVSAIGSRVSGFGSQVSGCGFRVSFFRFQVLSLGSRALGVRIGVCGSVFGVWGWGRSGKAPLECFPLLDRIRDCRHLPRVSVSMMFASRPVAGFIIIELYTNTYIYIYTHIYICIYIYKVSLHDPPKASMIFLCTRYTS